MFRDVKVSEARELIATVGTRPSIEAQIRGNQWIWDLHKALALGLAHYNQNSNRYCYHSCPATVNATAATIAIWLPPVDPDADTDTNADTSPDHDADTGPGWP